MNELLQNIEIETAPNPTVAIIWLHGLGADGIVGNATWPALTIVTQQGDSGAKVRAVQSQLNESGYGLTVDGSFGPATYSAVRSFQSAKGLGVDGVVGDNTWNKMAW